MCEWWIGVDVHVCGRKWMMNFNWQTWNLMFHLCIYLGYINTHTHRKIVFQRQVLCKSVPSALNSLWSFSFKHIIGNYSLQFLICWRDKPFKSASEMGLAAMHHSFTAMYSIHCVWLGIWCLPQVFWYTS